MPCSYVLLLDDNGISLKIAFRLFSSLGWCVIRCRTIDQAQQCYLDNELNLILTDFMLQEETALRLLKSVREYERESMLDDPLPIIGFSSHPKARADFLAAGGTTFYEKPLKKENVMEMISLYGQQRN